MNARRVNAAAGVLHAAQARGRATAAGLAADLEAAGLLQSPETAEEMRALRARVAELEAERHTTNDALASMTVAQRAAEGRADGLAVDRSVQRLRAVLAPSGAEPEREAAAWAVSTGEIGQGGEVLRLFATREMACEYVRREGLPFSLDRAREQEDGSLYVEGRTDWLGVDLHAVTGLGLAAGER
ncbi:hypothetical protein [Streptomyces youssoufiensis]